MSGGINVTAGTVSKTMRDAALYLTGYWDATSRSMVKGDGIVS